MNPTGIAGAAVDVLQKTSGFQVNGYLWTLSSCTSNAQCTNVRGLSACRSFG